MKKIIAILGIVALIFIGACSNTTSKAQVDLTPSEVMMVLHCLEMPEMGGCDEYKDIKLSHDQIDDGCELMPMMEICQEEEYLNDDFHNHENMMDEDDDHMMGEGMMSYSNINVGDNHNLYSTNIDGLKKAIPMQKIKVANGETLNLTAEIVINEIDGKEYKMFGYNGMVPGPIIEVNQGDEIYVNFKNKLDVNTTVHWHGLRVENVFDGVPGITQKTVLPNESFQYKLRFLDEGVYWYHPHVREDYQQEMGLYGNIIVKPKEDYYYNNVNKEELIILDDILIEDNQLKFSKETVDFTLMGRYGNELLINGDTNYNLEVNKGDVVRFYVTNVANARPFNFTIEGIKLKLIGSDLGAYETQTFIDSIVIAPAERYIIEAYFENEGDYKIKNINPIKTYNLGNINVNPTQTSQDYSNEFNTLSSNKYIEAQFNEIENYFEKPVDHELELTIEMFNNMGGMNHGMMGDDEDTIEWEDTMPMMNYMSNEENVKWILRDKESGKENMDINYEFNNNSYIKIKLYNNPNSAHPMQHPIHFHGQRFVVLTKDGIKQDNLVWKDTTLVPIGSTFEILLENSNPGDWLAHCHIAEHMHAGMMTKFKVQ